MAEKTVTVCDFSLLIFFFFRFLSLVLFDWHGKEERRSKGKGSKSGNRSAGTRGGMNRDRDGVVADVTVADGHLTADSDYGEVGGFFDSANDEILIATSPAVRFVALIEIPIAVVPSTASIEIPMAAGAALPGPGNLSLPDLGRKTLPPQRFNQLFAANRHLDNIEVLRQWKSGMKLDATSLQTLPIWIKLPDLELQFWTTNMLRKIESLIGRPYGIDNLTKDRVRFYACLMVEVDASKLFKEFIMLKGTTEDLKKQPIKYEFRLVHC